MRVLTPTSVEEACCMLGAHDPAPVPIAGATDVLVHWPVRQEAHDLDYLDLSGLGELRSVTWTDDSLTIGGLATYWDVIRDERCGEEFPLLQAAARQVGAVQIQSRGTWAGNIVNGSPAADGVPVLMAYDASVCLRSTAGTRRVSLDHFYTGYRKSVRRADELVTAIVLARQAYDVNVFHKVGPRRAQAITKVGVAVTRRSERTADRWRVVANSVAPTVRRCRAVESLLDGSTPVRSPDGFLRAVSADVSPIDDIRSTAAYRRTVLCRLLYDTLRGVSGSVE